jgi:hypothetical protein
MSCPVAVIFPGLPLCTNFHTLDAPLCTKFELSLPLVPSSAEIAFALTAPLPAGSALAIYYSTAPGCWNYLGSITNDRPSSVFPAVWARVTAPIEGDSVLIAKDRVLTIGCSLETAEFVSSLSDSKAEQGVKSHGLGIAIAEHVYQFIASFQLDLSGNYIQVPKNALNVWFDRFRRKLMHDPGFLKRQ